MSLCHSLIKNKESLSTKQHIIKTQIIICHNIVRRKKSLSTKFSNICRFCVEIERWGDDQTTPRSARGLRQLNVRTNLVRWPEYWPPIGSNLSRDLNTGLWLVQTDNIRPWPRRGLEIWLCQDQVPWNLCLIVWITLSTIEEVLNKYQEKIILTHQF